MIAGQIAWASNRIMQICKIIPTPAPTQRQPKKLEDELHKKSQQI